VEKTWKCHSGYVHLSNKHRARLEQISYDCVKRTVRRCRDRAGAVFQHSDWMRDDFALYDWLRRFPQCGDRAVTMP
jgi:hypothetical protein